MKPQLNPELHPSWDILVVQSFRLSDTDADVFTLFPLKLLASHPDVKVYIEIRGAASASDNLGMRTGLT